MFLDLEPFIVIEGDMGIFLTARVEARFLLFARARSVLEIENDRPRMDPQHSQSFEKIQEQGVRTSLRGRPGERTVPAVDRLPGEGSCHSRRGLFLRAVAARARPG